MHGFIIFWDKEEKPLKISPKEYKIIDDTWDESTHFRVQGQRIHKSDIRRLLPPQKPEPLRLDMPQEKPVSKEVLKKVKDEIGKRFSV